jgi:hypothetical protein
VSDGTTEGGQSQSSRYPKDLQKSTLALTRRDFGVKLFCFAPIAFPIMRTPAEGYAAIDYEEYSRRCEKKRFRTSKRRCREKAGIDRDCNVHPWTVELDVGCWSK